MATEKVTADLESVEKRLAAAAGTGAGAGVLACEDPVAAFREAPPIIRRAVLDELFTVTLRRGTRGSRTFNPETVIINWKGAA